MKELFNVVVIICSASLICTLVSNFVNDGSTKKILNLVLGAFVICSMIVPIKNAVSQIDNDMSQQISAQQIVASDDEAYSKEIIYQTKLNLEASAKDLLLQNNISINSCEIVLAQTQENRIIISSVCIYISKEDLQNTDLISGIIEENFGIYPSVVTE